MIRMILAILAISLAGINLHAATYPIAEPDMLDEIQSKMPGIAEKLDKEKVRIAQKALAYKGEELRPADKDNVFYVSPEYTLDKDIPRFDKNGKVIGILYPKGFKFNPIDYLISLPPPMIVFNNCDPKEADFVEKLQIADYMAVSSGCPVKDIKSKRKVYLVTAQMKKVFQLRHTVSVISVDKGKRAYKIEEYKLPKEEMP